jgi:hypothetical protein
MEIHKYTEAIDDSPGSIILSEKAGGRLVLEVLSRGPRGYCGAIELSREQLLGLLSDAEAYLGRDLSVGGKLACFGVVGTEQQQLRMRAFEMALSSPGVHNHRDVIGVAGEYHRRIVGDEPMSVKSAPGAEHPGYAKMQPHQQRVIDERVELVKKADALASLIGTKHAAGSIFSRLPEAEQMRLYRQLETMRTYSEILSERIVAFSPT